MRSLNDKDSARSCEFIKHVFDTRTLRRCWGVEGFGEKLFAARSDRSSLPSHESPDSSNIDISTP